MQPKTPLFTSNSQHPPRFGHAVYLGENVTDCIGMSFFVPETWATELPELNE